MPRTRSMAAKLLGFTNARRVPASDEAARLQERDARVAADTRTPAQVWLNEPPPGRSALTRPRNSGPPPPRNVQHARIDHWKFTR